MQGGAVGTLVGLQGRSHAGRPPPRASPAAAPRPGHRQGCGREVRAVRRRGPSSPMALRHSAFDTYRPPTPPGNHPFDNDNDLLPLIESSEGVGRQTGEEIGLGPPGLGPIRVSTGASRSCRRSGRRPQSRCGGRPFLGSASPFYRRLFGRPSRGYRARCSAALHAPARLGLEPPPPRAPPLRSR